MVQVSNIIVDKTALYTTATKQANSTDHVDPDGL